MSAVHVTAVAGSLREESYTRASLRVALDAAGAYDEVTTDFVDLRELALPVFDADRRDAGDAAELRERVAAADSVLLGTPMYHGTFSSATKNALDYCGFDQFENRTVGLLAVAGGSFPTPALDHLRSSLRALNAWVLPHQAAVPRAKSQFEGGEFANEELRERVETLGERAVEYANIEPEPPTMESRENVGAD